MWDEPLGVDLLEIPEDSLNYFTFNTISKRNSSTCFVLTEKVESVMEISQ